MKIYLYFSFFILLIFPVYFAYSQQAQLDTNFYITDGQVSKVVQEGSTIYVGGAFSYIGLNTGAGAIYNLQDGKMNKSALLRIEGTVFYSISDGKGGWYIGGRFTRVQGALRNGLAHILPNGQLDSKWVANLTFLANSIATPVYSLCLSGNTLFVGGTFTSVNGESRRNLAALDASTGQVTSWKADADVGSIALVISGNTLYASGGFSSIGGQTRYGLAALDATTGQVSPWSAQTNGGIRAMAISGNTIYIVGTFLIFGGQNRIYAAAIDATTGQLTPWNPNIGQISSGSANSLSISGNTVYVGGFFSFVGGQSRNNVAAIDATTGEVTAWNPNANGPVESIALSNSFVYLGGKFTLVGERGRGGLASVDAVMGKLTSWNPIKNEDSTSFRQINQVFTITASGDNIFVGGDFFSINRQIRYSLAAIDTVSNEITSWNPTLTYSAYLPSPARPVNAFAVSGNTVYVGGEFTYINGIERKNLAAIDATTGQLVPWNPSPNGAIQALALSGNTLYTGGKFTSIGGQSRNNVAAVNTTTGEITSWNPNANNEVKALLLSGNTLYAGGSFNFIGGQSRPYLSAIDATSGQITSWNPSADSTVVALAASGNSVYAGGFFKSVKGKSRNHLAAIDATSGQPTSWDPQANNPVLALAIAGNTLYAGGYFTVIGGFSKTGLAAIDALSGQVYDWNTTTNNTVYSLNATKSTLYIGGIFKSVAGKNMSNLTSFKGVNFQSTGPTGIDNDPILDSKILVYPNPNNGHFTLKFSTVIANKVNLQVFDGLGRTIISRSLTSSQLQEEIDLTSVSQGMYLLKIQTSTGVVVRRIVKSN